MMRLVYLTSVLAVTAAQNFLASPFIESPPCSGVWRLESASWPSLSDVPDYVYIDIQPSPVRNGRTIVTSSVWNREVVELTLPPNCNGNVVQIVPIAKSPRGEKPPQDVSAAEAQVSGMLNGMNLMRFWVSPREQMLMVSSSGVPEQTVLFTRPNQVRLGRQQSLLSTLLGL
eukprot:Blabericola_migrator_1__4862@NODE_2546_length_2624_cov_9_243645_g1592_i0_p2_GENE_NODE_2546_length_2624_cov_9_243645_g1592_i0NODE_2546_length_2624_cov_9_243645_g1592_i0_p2_ORF_typecomplete_len172_score19_18MRPL52/PF18699_1/0_31_NODE_2546_length_2624_cov_9_243645_g1592_i021092624